jgi:hypothetical protein
MSDTNRMPPHQDLEQGDIIIDSHGDAHLITGIETHPPNGIAPGWRLSLQLSGEFAGHGGRLNEACVVQRKVFNLVPYLRAFADNDLAGRILELEAQLAEQ